MDSFLSKNSTRERIDPATEDKQVDIETRLEEIKDQLPADPWRPSDSWSVLDNQSAAQTNKVLKNAPGAELSLYITDIIISNGATAGNIKLVEDATGTPVDILEVMYFAINGGAAIHLKTAIELTADKNLGYTSVSCTTHSITVCGYIASSS